jgi:hypothetical protein
MLAFALDLWDTALVRLAMGVAVGMRRFGIFIFRERELLSIVFGEASIDGSKLLQLVLNDEIGCQ